MHTEKWGEVIYAINDGKVCRYRIEPIAEKYLSGVLDGKLVLCGDDGHQCLLETMGETPKAVRMGIESN